MLFIQGNALITYPVAISWNENNLVSIENYAFRNVSILRFPIFQNRCLIVD